MTGKIIGYIRVSSIDQNIDRQKQDLIVDKLFIDRCSGKTIERPELKAMLDYIRDGDVVKVHSLDRLARNLDDLRKIVKTVINKKACIEFLKENLTFSGNDFPMSNLLLSVMGAFAEFERSLIRERQLEGIAIAKAKGRYKGRSPILTTEQIQSIKSDITLGIPKTIIAKKMKISRATLYNALKDKTIT
ncbi:MAG: DNA-invertase hin [Holosporales bacterium]